MSKIRCGLVGLGAMGKNHSRILRDLEGVQFIGAVDPNIVSQGGNYSFPLFSSIEQLAGEGIDAAVVSAPTSLHESIGLELAELGIPCLIEKPIAQNTPAAQRLVEAFTGNGVLGAIGHIERYNPAIRELKYHLEIGTIGEVFQIQTRRQNPFPARVSDVGCVKDLATHDIDLTLWVSQSSYTNVSAYTSYQAGRGVEDMLVAAAQLENKTIANHVVNWLSPLKERRTIVTGELGTLVADTLTGDLTLYRNGSFDLDWDAVARFRGVSEGEVVRFSFPKTEPLKTELETFLSAVKGNDEPTLVSLEAGLRVLEVAEAMLSSAESRSTVSLKSGSR